MNCSNFNEHFNIHVMSELKPHKVNRICDLFKNHAKKPKLNDNQSENEDIQAEDVGSQQLQIIVEQQVSI
jgi:hypothetical protein